jgi:hypothetical protein
LGKIKLVKWTEQVQNRIKCKVIVENTKTVLELYRRRRKKKEEEENKKKKNEKEKKNKKFRHDSINLFSLSLHETSDAGHVLPLREESSHQRRVLSYKMYADITHP